ncbi:MAG: type ISP restriction/modification enzyme [Candidatus Promineifilaceae bacterium]
MSIQLIQQYHASVDRKIRYGGTDKESATRNEFYNLVQHYARPRRLEFVPEINYRLPNRKFVTPDGTLKDALRQDWGYWEAKDTGDVLDDEIARKTAKGYPTSNILYEDTETAVLIQAGAEIARVKMLDVEALDALLITFVSYESREVRAFREAIEQFKADVPGLSAELRDIIEKQFKTNAKFRNASAEFLKLAQDAINPAVEKSDVREMIIQHILTQEIFNTIFDEVQFHQENAIARELGTVTRTFYKGATRRKIDAKVSGYYQTINARAAAIHDHQEKQKFLKVLYENFYKAYNPKGADRLGIVYTPNEIVRFMIEGADYLCHKHFGRTLGDKDVHILDPATGTGTFITELLDYLPKHQLKHKYKHELHCNEVAILPYYIANLNIEYTYQQITGEYEPFENIVFVDTLDNMGFAYQGKQLSLFGLVDENAARIKAQNEREISVIIGNPPYNAWQDNFNSQNANRPYKHVDERIKKTYIKHGTAQNQIGVYDMYTRFFRWATDRISENGVIAFITNNSFIDARSYDGFRKVIADEFDFAYIIDLGGNVRAISGKDGVFIGAEHTIFGAAAAVGISITFLIKQSSRANSICQLNYIHPTAIHALRDEKLTFLRSNPVRDIQFEHIKPSKRNNWINQTDNDWDELVPVMSKDVKSGSGSQAIFHLFSSGVQTKRDEWAYARTKIELERKILFMIDVYQRTLVNKAHPSKMLIKWDADLQRYLERGIEKEFDPKQIRSSMYRPFEKNFVYFDKHFNSRTFQLRQIFPEAKINNVIWFKTGSAWPFFSLAVDVIPDTLPQGASQILPLFRYDDLGNRVDNITDWGLAQFRAKYEEPSPSPSRGEGDQDSSLSSGENLGGGASLTKRDIFHYVYAVLHHPAYRQKYELNLKRDFPRIPLYADFWQWAAWGERLMDLHLNYETIDPFPLDRHDIDPATTRKAYKPKLKANKTTGVIELDTLTTLANIPAAAWTYRLGNRSALEWILDRYKERKPRHSTIREKFNTYKFSDYKTQVIDLLTRVTTVSIETMAIVNAMPPTVEKATHG